MENEKHYRIADISIEESIERCIKKYGIEGKEDVVNRVLPHPDLKQLKGMYLEAFYKKYKIGEIK